MAKSRRGRGGHGTGHFIMQRLTSVLLAVLAPWFVVASAFALREGGHAAAVGFLTQPVNAVGVALLAVIGLYHMSLGMEEVIADYIEKPATLAMLKFLNAIFPLALAAAALFALYSLNFGA